MSSYVSPAVRRLVEERAGGACEYCLIRERDTYFGCHVDHIISEKHDGPTELDNLALACALCNRAKGSDIASVLPDSQALVRLYHRRNDRWEEHFRINADTLEIESLTEIGEVTARLLRFNEVERLLERRRLAPIGHFPIARPRPK